jgi:pyridoxamine 5'-phosphate oxidase
MQTLDELLPDPLPSAPFLMIKQWHDEAKRRKLQPNPDAMVLATCTPAGRPSARVVLCKEIAVESGFIVFYTNYQSHKGRELAANPRAAVVMHWDHLHRQVRIEGAIVPLTAEQSDRYFAGRPWQSQLGAWASAQSRPVDSRAALLQQVAQTTQRFGTPDPGGTEAHAGSAIPRPPHWGGYQLWGDAVELWVEGAARVHDRARWTRTLAPQADGSLLGGPWSASRLQP